MTVVNLNHGDNGRSIPVWLFIEQGVTVNYALCEKRSGDNVSHWRRSCRNTDIALDRRNARAGYAGVTIAVKAITDWQTDGGAGRVRRRSAWWLLPQVAVAADTLWPDERKRCRSKVFRRSGEGAAGKLLKADELTGEGKVDRNR